MRRLHGEDPSRFGQVFFRCLRYHFLWQLPVGTEFLKVLLLLSMMFFRSSVVALALLAFPTQAETLSGRIVSIADGDTLTLLDASNQPHKIRLSGIDAPEKNQDFGQQSKTNLSALTFDQPATADCRKIDRYQRKICVIFVEGKDVGLEQIRKGMAWWYLEYTKDQTPQERADYQQAEFIAKIRRNGLWNSKNPIPPWDWRHGRSE